MCDECLDRVNSITIPPGPPRTKLVNKKAVGLSAFKSNVGRLAVGLAPNFNMTTPNFKLGTMPPTSNTGSAEEYKDVIKYLKDMKEYLERMHPNEVKEPKEKLLLFRVSVSIAADPGGKYRKNGSLRNFALGGVLYALGTDEVSLIATLQNGILKEVHSSRIGIGEHVGPFIHGHIISTEENK